MALEEIFSQFSLWMLNLLSSILHLLPLIYPIFSCIDPDPYLEYGSGTGTTKLRNKDSIWIWNHNMPQPFFRIFTLLAYDANRQRTNFEPKVRAGQKGLDQLRNTAGNSKFLFQR